MKKLTTLLCFALSVLVNVSCGLMEMDEGQAMAVIDMHLDRNTIYVTKGETFTLNPVFTPDSVSMPDIFWTVEDDSIVSFSNNTFTAINEGFTLVRAVSVANMKQDSCYVRVFNNWESIELPVTPYETVIYADVKVGNVDFNPEEMVLGAYINDELSGLAVVREAYGIKYLEIRVGQELFDPEGVINQDITLGLFDKRTHSYYASPDQIKFDCETHGTLSKLYKIKL